MSSLVLCVVVSRDNGIPILDLSRRLEPKELLFELSNKSIGHRDSVDELTRFLALAFVFFFEALDEQVLCPVVDPQVLNRPFSLLGFFRGVGGALSVIVRLFYLHPISRAELCNLLSYCPIGTLRSDEVLALVWIEE